MCVAKICENEIGERLNWVWSSVSYCRLILVLCNLVLLTTSYILHHFLSFTIFNNVFYVYYSYPFNPMLFIVSPVNSIPTKLHGIRLHITFYPIPKCSHNWNDAFFIKAELNPLVFVIFLKVKFWKKNWKLWFICTARTPQTCCILGILPACCKLFTSCNKSVEFIKLQQVCKNQICCNLIFADLLPVVKATCIKLVDKKSWPSTCSKLVGNLQQTCYHQAGASNATLRAGRMGKVLFTLPFPYGLSAG